ncbi:MAG: rRNA adenine dimethyltransferase family protein, partial [Acidobacteriota bacterium]
QAVRIGRLVANERARVIGNLPYNIATPLIQRLIEFRGCISEMVVMLQREVVDRMIARPGGNEYGYLSVLSQFHCELDRLFDIPPGAFRPSPKVYSSLVRLRLPPMPKVAVADERLFFELAQVLFSQRRKTILNNLRSGSGRLGLIPFADYSQRISDCAFDLGRRAETLEPAEIARLSDAIAGMKRTPRPM